MFRGRFEYCVDKKGRVAVPVKFREILTSGFDQRLIVTNFDGCLWAYPAGVWQELERKVGALPQFLEEVKALQRAFISAAQECPLDGQGRILIPSSLKSYAGIDKEVVFVGMSQRIEIWAKQNWEKAFAESEKKLGSLQARLAELGL